MIFGVDVSHWQDGFDVGTLPGEGMGFVLAKISEGDAYRDPSWPVFRDRARQTGILLGGYHYVTTAPPERQAATCRSWIGDPNIPIMLDHERGGGDWANLRAVLAAFRAAGLNVTLLYEPHWYWAEIGRPDMSGCGLALVASDYPSNNAGHAQALYRDVPDSYWSPYGGLTPTLLQFSSHAAESGMEVDAEAYRGDLAGLTAIFHTGAAPAPRRSLEETVATVSFDPTPRPCDVVGTRWQDTDPATWVRNAEEARTALPGLEGTITSITAGWATGMSYKDSLSTNPDVLSVMDGPNSAGLIKASGWLHYLRVFYFADPAHTDWRVVELVTNAPLIGNRSLPPVALPPLSTFLVASYTAPGGLHLGIDYL